MVEVTEAMIGARVSLKTTLGEDCEGVVFTYDSESSTVVLQQGEASTFRVVKTGCIAQLTVLAEAAPRPGSEDRPRPPLPTVSLETVRTREDRAVQKAKDDAKVINPKVSTRDQAIFHALHKTMPCDWREGGGKQAILVFDEVLIVPPYTVDDCKGKDGSSVLDRVQKVLGGVLQRLG